MEKEKMVLCIISGPIENFNATVKNFIINRSFRPRNALAFIHDTHLEPLRPVSFNDETLKTAQKLASELQISLNTQGIDNSGFAMEQTDEYFSGLLAWLTSLYDEKRRLTATLESNKRIIDSLNHLATVDVAMEKLFSMQTTKFRFGSMPKSIYLSSLGHISARDDLYFVQTSNDEEYVYIMYFTLPSAEERVDAYFAALKFERIWISKRVHGSPNEAVNDISEENRNLYKQISALDFQKEKVREKEQANFLKHYSFLESVKETYNYYPFAAKKDNKFYLVGLMPNHEADSLADAIKSQKILTCEIIKPSEQPKVSNSADHSKFLTLIAAEKKSKELYAWALDEEQRLTTNIDNARKTIRQQKYDEANTFLEEARQKAAENADKRIEDLNQSLEQSLNKIKIQFEGNKDKWIKLIFKAAIND